MGKKQKYKLPEHEQQHNRVDIFRPIKLGEELQQAQTAKLNNYKNVYTNETFISSTNDLSKINSLNNLVNDPLQSQSQQQSKQPSSYLKSKPKSSIWSTTSSFVENSKYFNDNFIEETNQQTSNNLAKEIESSKKRKRIILIGLVVMLLISLITVGLGIGLTINKSISETIDFKNECFPRCKGKRFCVSSEYDNKNATCICRPGYVEDPLNNECEEFLCYENYYPYTYLDDTQSHTAASKNILNMKPYCCPNENFLTPSCCGLATSNNSLTSISKRIIGGSTVAPGVFPWIVYVTQVYRANTNRPLVFVKNCSGALISDRYVLTAAHCIDLDPSIKFNNEFQNTESIIRVYFGFVDKEQVFQSTINASYERRTYNIIKHPNYDRLSLQNDLALIQLEKPVSRNQNVDYLCLFNYSLDDSLVDNFKLYSAGWGSINPNYEHLEYPNTLHYVDAVIFPMKSCYYIISDPFYTYLFNPKTHVCAGYDASFRKDTCYADSGSPLMVQLNSQWFAYGIVSFGSEPDCAQGPSMYIRVAYYYDWIKSIAV